MKDQVFDLVAWAADNENHLDSSQQSLNMPKKPQRSRKADDEKSTLNKPDSCSGSQRLKVGHSLKFEGRADYIRPFGAVKLCHP